ncbi:MAG: N-acetylmuramoyl-L-alanine amidase [Acidobacteriia bacterium]|nr:N-acetylmuramoyl-L-alanine amidase [Terriglobia bacterium]
MSGVLGGNSSIRLATAALAAAALSSLLFLPASAAQSRNERRQAAQTQYERAQSQREALGAKPVAERTLAEYKRVVTAYRRVYLITPHAAEVQDALVAVAELNVEMGARFGQHYYQAAVDTYQFLLHEYPGSHYSQEALLKIARLQRGPLDDPALAKKTYEEFLKRYRRSAQRVEVKKELAEMSVVEKSPAAATKEAKDAKETNETGAAARNAALAASAPAAAGESAAAGGGIPRLKRISSKTTSTATRVVIDLEDKVAYTSARIKNPDRVYFDLQPARLSTEVANRDIHIAGEFVKAVRVAQNQNGVVRIVFDVAGVLDYAATLEANPARLVVEFYGSQSGATLRAAGKTAPDNVPLPVNNTSLMHSRPGAASPEAAAPTRDGQATLTRALGLKISRIVIDAGHGGHDTGTIGPTGLLEKDLCLDVALRLGNIIEQRLPGANVIYTRSDDVFIPLERRTEIANEAKADLFISIHANSSRNHSARGVETYYLNLKGSPEAMDVAARENATASGGIHELEDMVKKIARTEKIDESREFAADVQDTLTQRVQKSSRKEKDRGVRKAPFVVLIGADMPSILTEISFISNPSDEKLLKKPDYRQRIADGLFQGVSSYLQSLNSITHNLAGREASLPSSEETRNQR